jgi:cytosine/adenosine deaminase-related metal-dependent hydrolase
LGFDGASHTLFEDGEVIVDNGFVVHVGPQSDRAAAQQEDLGVCLLAPGFIDLNALADADTTILGFGSAGELGRGTWSAAYAPRAHDVLTGEERVAATRAAFGQLLLSGITTALPVTSLLFRAWAESGAEFEAIGDLAGELGIRLILGPSFRSAVNVIGQDGVLSQFADDARGIAGLEGAIEFIRGMGGRDGLVSGLLVPSTIDTCSDELLVRTARAAEALDVPFRLHCCQSQAEAELIWARSGKTSIGHLRDLGILSNRALLPHAVNLGGPLAEPKLIDEDLSALAESGAVVVHCPLVIGRGGRRLKDFAGVRERGIRIGLGTDTAPPDMLMNLQTGLAMARIDGGHRVGPADYFNAATLGGADALGRQDLGRIATGAAADLVAWDLSALDAQPIHDPLEALFLMPPSRRARQVWVAGRRVVKDGAVVGLDERAAAHALQASFEKLRASYAERHWKGQGWRTLFPPTFPIHQPA